MFDIEYKGANSLVISTKKTRVVFDPASLQQPPKDLVKADDIVVVTEDRFAGPDTGRLLLDSPGEYEVGEVALKGLAAQRHIDTSQQGQQAVIYRVEIGGLRLAVIGNVTPGLSEQQLEQLGVVDIALLPVGGGGYTLDATAATAMVRQLDPKLVVLIHYRDTAVQYEVPQDDVEVFEKELAAPVAVETKLKFKSAAGLPESLTVVRLARS